MRFDPETHTVHAGGRSWQADIAYTVISDNWFGERAGWDGDPTYGHRIRQCRIRFESGWAASIIWGSGTYSTNHDAWHEGDPFAEEPFSVEVGVIDHTGELRMRRHVDEEDGLEWHQVESYVTDAALVELLDKLADLPTDDDFGEAPPSHEEVMAQFAEVERLRRSGRL